MRNRPRFVMLAAAMLAIVATSAYGQDKRVFGSFGAGWTMPNGEVRDRLGDGFNVTFGVEVKVTPVVGIEGLYSFNGLGQKQISIPVSALPPVPTPSSTVPTDFFGDMNMQYGSAAVVLRKPDGQVKPYGLAGMGVYYRPIKITTPGVGYVPGYCDPWWYVCYPGGWVPVENIVGERSSTDFGMVFGGGVNINVFYAELRYHYIWGPTIETSTASPPIEPPIVTGDRKANGQFLALTFGVRF
jgi:opacity protein-like surface antigen